MARLEDLFVTDYGIVGLRDGRLTEDADPATARLAYQHWQRWRDRQRALIDEITGETAG